MSVSPLRRELARIVDATAIVSPAAFVFAGRPSSGAYMTAPGMTLSPAMAPAVMELMGRLYESCYSNRFRGAVPDARAPRSLDDPEWIEALSRANQTRERWEDGWRIITNMPSGQVLAQRGGTTRMLSPGEFIKRDTPGAPLAPGAFVSVYFPRESRATQTGFYFVFSETPGDAFDDTSLVRFYWNVTPDGGAGLTESISTELNRYQIPFRFKILGHREMFGRADSAILYAPRRHAHIVLEICSDIRERTSAALRDDVPLFTLRLAAGLGFAEDPGITESFGMSRCRLLAEGIWTAYVRGAQTTEDRMRIVEQHFASQGISLDRPWLNAGSAAQFEFGEPEAHAA